MGAVAALIAATLPLTATQAAQAAPSAQARLASAAKKTPNRNVTAIVQFKAKVNERQVPQHVVERGGVVMSDRATWTGK